ncbi:AraC family transcriptional regulator [Agrobacterium sp. a22-2]|uniref:helix-turn-helix transcriptional regulator n=1 Tax=Agrobacterium sp. a22-2 TaxID=2283840 RepID=UPI0014474163|nr:AraC family transcriptional regulator [Agrobacterium sp. a22-2]NKN38373.1 AraC family transcriptional regulator [Agrobacterium sp. a22-2]
MAAQTGFRVVDTFQPGLRAVLADTAHAFPRHSHDEFGIGLIEAGGQLSASGRGQVTAGAGDIITVNPGEVHDGAPLRNENRRWRMLYLEPSLMRSLAHGIDPEADGEVEFSAPVLSDRRIALRFAKAFHGLSERSSLAGEEDLLTLTAGLLSARRAGLADPLHPGLRRVKAMLDDAPDTDISLTLLADEAGLSRFQVLRSFAAHYGLTPHAYLMQRRANLARDLIRSGSSLASVAFEAGYADQSHMTRDFRRRYGLTPSAFAGLR